MAWNKILLHHVPAHEDRNLLEGFLGYSLTGETGIPQMLVFSGPRDTGKSVILNFIEKLLGPELIAKESIKQVIENPAHAVNIVGKQLSIAPEVQVSLRDLDALKRLIDFEGVAIHIMHKSRSTVPHNCKFICSTNNDGWIPNHDHIEKRLRVIAFENPVELSLQDNDLVNKLVSDSQIIVHRLLSQYLKFRGITRFPLNGSTTKYLRTAHENVNPIVEWVHDNDLGDGPYWHSIEHLYAVCVEDLKLTGMTKVEFAKKLKDAGITNEQRRRVFEKPDNYERQIRGRMLNKKMMPDYDRVYNFQPTEKIRIMGS